MSNFICPTCGITNIDCGKDGYKTAREIELEKKLEIAVKALKRISDNDFDCFLDSEKIKLAQQALKEIEG